MELIELYDMLIEDLTVARLTESDNAQIAEETSVRDEEHNEFNDLIVM